MLRRRERFRYVTGGLRRVNCRPSLSRTLSLRKEPTTKKRLAEEKVTTAIDKLQERFGRRAVMKGFLWEAESSVKEVKEKE